MPSPSAVGGGLMGYPSTVDPGLVAPIYLGNDASLSTTNAVAVTAGAAYFVLVPPLQAAQTFTQMRCFVSVLVAGNIDMGIYDATGTGGAPNNKLYSTGAIAATANLFTQNLSVSATLGPGIYWLAVLSTSASQLNVRQVSAAGMGPAWRTTATGLSVLPATAGAGGNTINMLALEALIASSAF